MEMICILSAVQPVAILSAVFCTVCSFCMFVSEINGDQTVLAYSSRGLVFALYVATSVSFCLPQLVDVRDLIMFNDFLTSVFAFLVCSLNVSVGLKITPRIFGFLIVGMT